MSHEGMSAQKLAQIKSELEGRRQELEQEMTGLYQEKFSDDQVQDVADQALSSTMESLKASIHDTKNVEYKRISRALEMIEEGSYGICADCQKPITERRLEYYPDATRCLVCQEAYEEQGA
jgi:DnaK suppressor protein